MRLAVSLVEWNPYGSPRSWQGSLGGVIVRIQKVYAGKTEFLALTVSETIQKDTRSSEAIWCVNVNGPAGTSFAASDNSSLRTMVSSSIH